MRIYESYVWLNVLARSQIEMGFDNEKNNSLIKHLLQLWKKKNPDFLPFFQT